MRRFQALLMAGLLAAPTGAVAHPESSDWSVDNKPRLGVMVMSLTPELRTHYGSTDATGVLVAKVEPGSPAALAGIAVGDMIVDVRGTKVDDAADVVMAVGQAGKNERLTVKAMRDRKLQTFDVKLGNTTTSTLDAFPGLRWLREMFNVRAPERSNST